MLARPGLVAEPLTSSWCLIEIENSRIGAGAQLSHLEVLAKLYIARRRHEAAAAVYEAVATRASGLGEQQVALATRTDAYQNAVLQVRLELVHDRDPFRADTWL